MKKVVIVVLVVLFWVGVAVAAGPYVKTQPQVGVVSCTITGDTFFAGPYTPLADGSVKVDLAGISTGSHTITANVCNLWGCLSSDPFVFNKQLPVKPVITIEAN